MNSKTKRQFCESGLLFATFSEFIRCWGSGRRSRLFMESMNGQAFMNFSTFLGNPGRDYFRQNKMAPGESNGYPRSHQAHIDPKSSKQHKRKKSKKKAERDNQRAALFQ